MSRAKFSSLLAIGHRGAMGYEPENTLLSVQKALSLGVDWIEVDVYALEQHLIVFHDRRLERTTNGTGYLQEQSLAYLRSLDAGKGQQIPFLEEVIDTVQRKARINIELKGGHGAELVTNLILSYGDRGWQKQDFLVSSFNHYELAKIQQTCGQIPLGLLVYGLPLNYLEIATYLQVEVVIMGLDFVTKEVIKMINNRGFKALVYTVNEPDDIEQMRQFGVDGIFTNYPDRVK